MCVRNEAKRGCGAAALVLAVCLAGFGERAVAAERVALVIGNGDYAHFGDLRNPANDACLDGYTTPQARRVREDWRECGPVRLRGEGDLSRTAISGEPLPHRDLRCGSDLG